MLSDNFDQVSQEITNVEAGQFLAPNKDGGRIYYKEFAFNTGASGIDSTPTAQRIALTKLPPKARPVHIHLNFEAMGSSATIDLGLAEPDGTEIDYDLYADGTAVASAGTANVYPITNADITQAVPQTTQESVLVASAMSTADWAADKDLKGWVAYVVGN